MGARGVGGEEIGLGDKGTVCVSVGGDGGCIGAGHGEEGV